ncbi:inactive poly [ADP-ribose] polymerase SRO5 [Pyrus ussuriensis x Pyrus communis]|uniref:Inactive poly [ADP-ribose] polymerase SRO5 n=1 Tax=Pyrus ussuriensis x Pyrus communis TaxID=2448454 RepID=A0A5N5GF56_9ROSA|nr:inactive poly [ADP-ribose] polymerase SRO5 [Pyrus ussuriensis x Pyrus communis]
MDLQLPCCIAKKGGRNGALKIVKITVGFDSVVVVFFWVLVAMEYSNDDTNLSSGNSSEDELSDQFTDSGTTTDSAPETVQSSISNCESVVD